MGRRGFTLIELSIVLVIIGLVIGGIVVGRDLIEGFRIRSAIGQIEKYKTAVGTFQLKYNALPGDMTEAQADDAGFTFPSSRPDTAYITHGNQLIEYGNTNATALAGIGGEGAMFWQDLSFALLIEGSFTSSTISNLTTATMGTILPASVIGHDNWIAAGGVTGGFPSPWQTPYVPRGNYFFLAGIASTNGSGRPTTQSNLSTIQAQAIDSKVDDGYPFAGTVRASNYTTDLQVNFLTQSANNPCGALRIWGASGDIYQTKLYSNTLACQLSFRFTN